MSEPWIRVHSNLIGKKVVWRCVKSCGIPPESAVGHLVMLWGQAAQHTVNGDLSAIPDEQIEDWARWRGEVGAFARFVRSEHVSDGHINDWDEYAGKLEARRAQDRMRKSKRNSAGIPAETSRDVHVNSIPTRANEDEDDNGTSISSSNNATPDVGDVGAYRDALITAANQGMQGNPAIGDRFNPIPWGHGGSHEAADEMHTAGVPLDFARSVVHAIARSYRPEGRSRQVTSLKYCTGQVIDRWRAEQARTMASSTDLPGAAPSAPNRFAPPRAKIDASIEEAARIQARRRGRRHA